MEYPVITVQDNEIKVRHTDKDRISPPLLSEGETTTRKNVQQAKTVQVSGGGLFVPTLDTEFTMLPHRWKVCGPAEHDAEVNYDYEVNEAGAHIHVRITLPDSALEREEDLRSELSREQRRKISEQQAEERSG